MDKNRDVDVIPGFVYDIDDVWVSEYLLPDILIANEN